MKLTVFQSAKGDCLLLTGAGGERVLVDGGMAGAFSTHVAPALGALRAQNVELDLVYVSHIDQDHISGVLRMLDDAVAWRVHDFQIANGNPTHKAPKAPRPPEVKAIWNNAFHDQVDKNNADRIEDMLAASASVLSGTQDAKLMKTALRHQSLANSIPEALQVSRRIGAGQLGIPLNAPFGNKLAMVRPNDPVQAIAVGGLKVRVLAPFEEDLDELRKEWNAWLENNEEVVENIRRKARDDEDLLGNEVVRLIARLTAEAKVLGNRAEVTAPNLASLMLLVEEGSKKVLLTGDGHSGDVVKGLKHHGKLSAQGKLHVDVLKVQHHGAAANIDPAFCKAVTADHYVFCGNGFEENPELDVIKALVKARRAAKPSRPFKLWFNSSSAVATPQTNKDHMKKVETLVASLAAAAPANRVQSFFLTQSSFELPV
jgi:beta-lactamase superfamily II metal-dependent hydrolase